MEDTVGYINLEELEDSILEYLSTQNWADSIAELAEVIYGNPEPHHYRAVERAVANLEKEGKVVHEKLGYKLAGRPLRDSRHITFDNRELLRRSIDSRNSLKNSIEEVLDLQMDPIPSEVIANQIYGRDDACTLRMLDSVLTELVDDGDVLEEYDVNGNLVYTSFRREGEIRSGSSSSSSRGQVVSKTRSRTFPTSPIKSQRSRVGRSISRSPTRDLLRSRSETVSSGSRSGSGSTRTGSGSSRSGSSSIVYSSGSGSTSRSDSNSEVEVEDYDRGYEDGYSQGYNDARAEFGV